MTTLSSYIIANDDGVDADIRRAADREILKDTLILHELPAWRKSRKRKPLETVLFHELVSYRDYVSGDALSYWRSTSGFEVDFVIGDHTAVEARAKENVSPQDLKSLVALGEEGRMRSLVCASLEPRRRRVGEITILPWRDFLDALWGGKFKA